MTAAPSDEPLVVLLTAAGSIARRHARNLRVLRPRCRLLAVCRSPGSRAWAEQEGVEPVESVAQGLQARPDLAVVASASADHADDLVALLPAVPALYVEKPVVASFEDLQRLESALQAAPAHVSLVGCNLRWHGAVQRLQQALQDGLAGPLALASLRVGQWLPDWRPGRDHRASYSASRAAGGGVLLDLVHELDLACCLFGPIAHGQAAAGRLDSLQLQADAAATMALLMRSGLPVQVSMDYVSRQPVREVLAIGERGTLRLDLPARSLALAGPQGVQSLATEAADWDMAASYVRAMEELLQAREQGGATRYSLTEALPVTRWMLTLDAGAWRAAEDPCAP